MIKDFLKYQFGIEPKLYYNENTDKKIGTHCIKFRKFNYFGYKLEESGIYN